MTRNYHSAKVAQRRAWAEEMKNATGGDAATSSSTSGDPTTPKAKETIMGKNTAPPIGADDITHFRHVVTGNSGQTLTVEVISFVDDGQVSPPILTTHGNLDLSPDQAVQLADALTEASTAWSTAHASWIEGLR